MGYLYFLVFNNLTNNYPHKIKNYILPKNEERFKKKLGHLLKKSLSKDIKKIRERRKNSF